ncbi:MAG: Stk1 family PASTA domain-containing Ser/Thr kinase [Peptococcaceae bacterium]|nr:Stk1 family PASTA domain-containing Ser/Thr kinase [Peptococcaceae bacterium]
MGKVFGNRYEVIEQIGSGGMAIVFKAKDMLLNRIVTVKVLREQFVTDQNFIRRFRREAQAAASLSHANIVSIYDVGKDEDIEYIVMEYVEGRNLKEIIRNYAPLLPGQAIEITKQIAEAIKHAHLHRIIHRDIKPHNILVTDDGQAKVTDFGIARAVSAATVTHTGDIVGSVHYLSPEQARGIQSNEQSDLYSLGIILYELVTGQIPYDGETAIAIAMKHLEEQPLPPSQLNPKISPSLEAVIMKAIEKDPADRYASADELLKDLNRVQKGQTIADLKQEHQTSDLERTQTHKPLRPPDTREVISEKSRMDDASRRKIGQKTGNKGAKSPWLATLNRKKIWVAAGIFVFFLILFGGLSLRSYLTVAETTVPDLYGKSLSEADLLLTKQNLVLSTKDILTESSDTVTSDLIVRQNIPPNTQVKVGHEIQVTISAGPTLIAMPDLKSLDQEGALNKLTDAGFLEEKISFILMPSTTQRGYVVDQNPQARSPWSKNSDIDVYLSSGPQVQMVTMPDLVGATLEEAQNTLLALKLTPISDLRKSDLYGVNRVIETHPKAGDSIEERSQVTIVVSLGQGQLGVIVLPSDGRLSL